MIAERAVAEESALPEALKDPLVAPRVSPGMEARGRRSRMSTERRGPRPSRASATCCIIGLLNAFEA